MAWCDVVERRTLRECRHALGQSQAAFAAMLGVPPESYRTWDAGRRATPSKVMVRARALATHRDDRALLPLPVLALLIGVHVKTLRAAARDRRLPVTYDTRTTFRRLRARATLAAARQFRHSYFGRQVRPADRREPPSWASVPSDYDAQIRALRRARVLSQAQLATLVGAAHKAVVHTMGGAEAVPLAGVLATTRRAPLASVGAPVSGNAPFTRVSYPCGGGVIARLNSRVGMRRRCRLDGSRRVMAGTSRSIDSGYTQSPPHHEKRTSHPCVLGCP